MNKEEFLKILSKKMDTSSNKANKALNAVFDTIGEAIEQADKLVFVGFGTFKTSIAKARDVAIPLLKGKKVHIPERRIVKFSAGAKLKEKAASTKPQSKKVKKGK